jgi:glucans biosynthesis protein C
MDTTLRPHRLHELDWLRIIAIAILIGYHTGMIFVSWGWHIQSEQTSRLFETVMAWLHYWRMPLLLFVSGAGSFFALRRRTAGGFLAERHRRLLVPLIFGMLMIVPPQIYFERIDQYGSFLEFYPSVFELVPYPLGGSLSWHHLWFILYLLIYSIIALPLFLYLRSPRADSLFDQIARVASKRGGLAVFLLPIMVSQFALRPFFPHETHALVDDWAFFTLYFLFFLFGFVCCRDLRLWELLRAKRRENLSLALLLMIPFYGGFFSPVWTKPIEIAYAVSAVTMGWFWVLTAVGYGQVWLRRPARWLPWANEAIYPVYILHQTVIVMIGYFVLRQREGIYLNFLLIAGTAVAVTLIIYHLIVRPFALTRLLFGMKPVAVDSADRKRSEPSPGIVSILTIGSRAPRNEKTPS